MSARTRPTSLAGTCRGGRRSRRRCPARPAEKAGLKAGDIVLAIDRIEIDTAAELNAAIDTRRPGTEVRLSVLFGGRDRRVAATLAARPKPATTEATAGPQLMLDTGGHMAKVNWPRHHPRRQADRLGLQGQDHQGLGCRDGQDRAHHPRRSRRQAIGERSMRMALSPDGRWLAVGGQFHRSDRAAWLR